MTNTTQTILLLESGDLEVYDYKRPEKSDGLLDNFNAVYSQWLSTKRTVKMGQGESTKLYVYLFNMDISSHSPIDVSDIVEVLPTICSGFGECTCDHLGYFKEPVREGESQMDMLYDLFEMRDDERSFTYILQHFTINRK